MWQRWPHCSVTCTGFGHAVRIKPGSKAWPWCALMNVRRKLKLTLGFLFCLQGKLNKHSVHWAAALRVGLRWISFSLLWEGKNRKMDFVNAMGLCCYCNFIGMLQWGKSILHLMHLRYDASFVSRDAQCQQQGRLQPVPLGTTYRNALRCPKRITGRNVSAFLRCSVFLCSERQWDSTPQNAVGKNHLRNFCILGRWFITLNSLKGRSSPVKSRRMGA